MITAIHKHVSRFRVEQQTLRDDELKSILTNVSDEFRKHGAINGVLTSDDNLKAMYFLCRDMIKNEIYKKILHPQIIDHELFSLMGNTILFILQKSNNDATNNNNQLTNYDWNAFHAMALLLTSSLPSNQFEDKKVNKIIVKTFFSEKFMMVVKECIESLVLNKNQNFQIKCRILSYIFQHVYVHSKTYKGSLRSLLLNPIVRCITSKFYTDQFSKIEEESADFFLFDCPCFVLSNSTDRHDEIANLLCQSLLNNYKNIISHRGNRKHTDPSRNQYLSAYLKLLNHCALIESTRNMFVQYLPSIVTQLFTTVQEYLSLVDGEKAINSIKDEELVAAALTLLYNLISNSFICDFVKQNAPKSILLLLCSKGQQITIPKSIQFAAKSLVALTTDDIDQLDQPGEVTSLYLTYLTKAVKSDSQMYAGVDASRLLTNITVIAQNDEVKEQIVENGALKLLSDCVYDPIIAVEKIQTPALTAIWTVSFNGRARYIWKTDEKLIRKLQTIFQSGRLDQQHIVDGILWHLINEERFRNQQLNIQRTLVLANGTVQNTATKDDSMWVKINHNGGELAVLRENLTEEQKKTVQMKESEPYKYDIMISYCHKNKAICEIIYNCLLKTGKYKIWFDKERIHGSTMARMGEGIEESHLMISCMSSAYKLSYPCRSECGYAFRCEHPVLCLKVEPNYKPSGWLGIFLGDKYYVDVTKHDFLTTFKDIIKQISIQRNETPDYSLIDTIVTSDIQEAVTNALKVEAKSNHTATTTTTTATTVSPISLSSGSNSNQTESLTTMPLTSSQKITTPVASSPQKTGNPSQVPDMKKTLDIKSPRPDLSTTSKPLINSTSGGFTSISNVQNKAMGDYCTPENREKYYPSTFEYGDVDDDNDFSNNFTLKNSSSSISSLLDDEWMMNIPTPLMNDDTISVLELSTSMSEVHIATAQ